MSTLLCRSQLGPGMRRKETLFSSVPIQAVLRKRTGAAENIPSGAHGRIPGFRLSLTKPWEWV